MRSLKSFSRLFTKVAIFALAASYLTACSGSRGWVSVPKGDPTSETSEPDRQYSIDWNIPANGEVAPGYLINLQSPDPKVNGDFRVEFDRVVKLPYDITVNTTSLSEEELVDKIRSAYKTYFRSPADVKISIAKKEYLLDVQGLVKKPGQYPFKENASLDEIIARAEGLSESNNRAQSARYVRISGRSGRNGLIRLADYHSGAKAMQPRWQGGEVLFFQSEGGSLSDSERKQSNIVHILGQVKDPGDYAVEENADFFTYLVKAQGPNDRADLNNVTLIRSQKDQTQALSFDMQDVENIPHIQAGDTLIFNADNATNVEKSSRLWANFANIVSTIGVLIIATK